MVKNILIGIKIVFCAIDTTIFRFTAILSLTFEIQGTEQISEDDFKIFMNSK